MRLGAAVVYVDKQIFEKQFDIMSIEQKRAMDFGPGLPYQG